jgi:hypothetical protein
MLLLTNGSAIKHLEENETNKKKKGQSTHLQTGAASILHVLRFAAVCTSWRTGLQQHGCAITLVHLPIRNLTFSSTILNFLASRANFQRASNLSRKNAVRKKFKPRTSFSLWSNDCTIFDRSPFFAQPLHRSQLACTISTLPQPEWCADDAGQASFVESQGRARRRNTPFPEVSTWNTAKQHCKDSWRTRDGLHHAEFLPRKFRPNVTPKHVQTSGKQKRKGMRNVQLPLHALYLEISTCQARQIEHESMTMAIVLRKRKRFFTVSQSLLVVAFGKCNVTNQMQRHAIVSIVANLSRQLQISLCQFTSSLEIALFAKRL